MQSGILEYDKGIFYGIIFIGSALLLVCCLVNLFSHRIVGLPALDILAEKKA